MPRPVLHDTPVLRAACSARGVPLDVARMRRTAPAADARRIAVALLLGLDGLSLMEAARTLGYANHTTLVSAWTRHQALMEIDPEYASAARRAEAAYLA